MLQITTRPQYSDVKVTSHDISYPQLLAPLMKVGNQLEGKTCLTEISTNSRPNGLIFGTHPFPSRPLSMQTMDTLMAMAMMVMAILSMIGTLLIKASQPIFG